MKKGIAILVAIFLLFALVTSCHANDWKDRIKQMETDFYELKEKVDWIEFMLRDFYENRHGRRRLEKLWREHDKRQTSP